MTTRRPVNLDRRAVPAPSARETRVVANTMIARQASKLAADIVQPTEQESSEWQRLDFFPYHWEINDHDGLTSVVAWVLDKNSEPNLLVVEGYLPYFYVQVPLSKSRELTPAEILNRASILNNWLLSRHHHLGIVENYYSNDRYPLQVYSDQTVPLLKVCYRSRFQLEKAVTDLKSFKGTVAVSLKDGRLISIPEIVEFTLQEEKYYPLDLIKRLMSSNKNSYRYSGWQVFEVKPRVGVPLAKGYIPEWIVNHEPDIPQPDGSYLRLPASTITTQPNPVILSFDLESYTPDPATFMPRPDLLPCPCYLLTCYIGRLQDPPEKHQCKIIALAERFDETLNTDPQTELIIIEHESQMTAAFAQVLEDSRAIVITGYNICWYDMWYLHTRNELFSNAWPNCSFLRKADVKYRDTNPNSERPDMTLQCSGRIVFDVFRYAMKALKLPKYSLSAVAKVYLKKDKLDVPYEEQFVAIGLVLLVERQFRRLGLGDEEWSIIKKLTKLAREWVATLDHVNWMKPNEELLQGVLNILARCRAGEGGQHYQSAHTELLARYAIAQLAYMRIIDYGQRDCELPWLIFANLGLFTYLTVTAATCYVNPQDIGMKGQQIRTFSIVVVTSRRTGYFLNHRKVEKFPMTGGRVIEPIPGVYQNVATFDFTQLYPSIMIARNLCYSTLIVGTPPPGLKYHSITTTANNGELHTFNWVDKDVRKGVVVEILENLIKLRKHLKDQLLLHEKGSPMWLFYNMWQEAIKVIANSIYGFFGVGCNTEKMSKGAGRPRANIDKHGQLDAYTGLLPMPEGSKCITSEGAKLDEEVQQILEQDEDAVVLYGDTDSIMAVIPSVEKNFNKEGKALAERISVKIRVNNGDNFNVEYENTAIMEIIGKKCYVKATLNDNDQIKFLPNGDPECIAKGVPTARRDRSKCLTESFHVVSMMGIKMTMGMVDLTEIYRYVITFCAHLAGGGAGRDYFTIIKSYDASKDGYIKQIVDRMRDKYGENIDSGDRFDYMVCDARLIDEQGRPIGPWRKPAIGKVAMTTTVYERLLAQGKAPLIDYGYYIEGMANQIDNLLMNVIGQLPVPFLALPGYQRSHYSRVRQFCDGPVLYMTEMAKNMEDFQPLLDSFDKIVAQL